MEIEVKETWLVAIDNLEGGFELTFWSETENEANEFYEKELNGNYPDKEGRNKHIFKMVRTSGNDLNGNHEQID